MSLDSSPLLHSRILQDADIEIDHKPLYLKDKSPSIYADFTSPNTAHLMVSIDPEITSLLTNSTFTDAVEAQLGDFTTVEIHVDPNKEVSVRLPGTERYELINVRDERINRDLTSIVRKTQEAYARFQDSLPSTPKKPKPLDPQRFQEKPQALPDDMEKLRDQVTDLQHQLHTLKLQRELDQQRHQIQELSRQIRELGKDHADVHHILENAQALFQEEGDTDLVAAIAGLQDKLRSSQLTVKELTTELEALRQAKSKKVGALEASLAEAHALFDSTDTRPLPAKIQELQQQNALLTHKLDRAERGLATSLEELEQLRPLADKVPGLEQTLDDIRAALEGDQDTDLLSLTQAIGKEFRRLQAAHPEVREALEDQTSKLVEALAQIEALTAKEAASAQRIQELQEALRQQKETLERQISGLKDELAAAASQNTALQQEHDTQLDILKQVQQGLEVDDDDLASLPTHVRTRVAQHTALTSQLGQLKSTSSDQLAALEKALQEAQSELSSTRDTLSGENTQLTRTLTRYTATLSAVQKALPQGLTGSLPDRVVELVQTSAQLQEALEASGHAKDELFETNAALQQQVDELSSIQDQVQSLESQLKESTESLAKESAALEASQARLQEAEATNSAHQEALKAIQTQLQAPDADADAIVQQIAALQQALAKSQQELSTVTDAYSQLQGTAQATTEKLQEAQTQNALLSQKLDTAEGQLEASLEELQQLRPLAAKVPGLEQTLDDIRAALEGDQDTDILPLAQAIGKEFRRLQAAHPEVREALENQTSKLVEALAQIEALTAKEAASAQRIQELQEALHQQKEALESRIAALESELVTTSSQKASLQKTLDTTQDALQHQVAQNTALQTAHDTQLDILKQVQQGLQVDDDLDSLPTHVRTRVEHHTALTSQLGQVRQAASNKEAELQAALQEAQVELSSTRDALSGENTQLTRTLTRYTATLSAVQKALPQGLTGSLPDRVVELVETSAQLQEALEASGHANANLLATNTRLEQRLEQLASFQDQAQSLEQQLKESTESLAKESAALKASQARLDKAEVANSALQDALTAIQTQLQAPDADADTIVAQIAALQEALHASRSQNTQDQQTIAALKEELRSLEDSLSGQNHALTDQVRALQAELGAIEQLLPKGDKGTPELQERVGSFKQAYDQLKEDLKATSATNTHLEDRIKGLDQVLRQREESLHAFEQANRKLQQQHTSDVDTNTQLTKDLASAKEELQAVQHTLAVSETRFVEFESSRREVERLTAILTALQKQLRDPTSLQAQLEAVGEAAPTPFESISQLVESRLSEIAQAHETIQEQAEELDALTEKMLVLEQEHEQQLKAMEGATAAEKAQLEHEFQLLRKVEHAGYARTQERYNKAKEGWIATIKQLRQDVKDYQAQLHDALKAQKSLRKDIRALEIHNSTLQKGLASSETVLKDKEQDLEAEIRRVDRCRQEIEALTRERNALMQKLEEQGDTLNDSIEESSLQQERRAHYQQRNEELALQIEVLEAQLDKDQEHIDALTRENHTLRRLLGKIQGVTDDARLPTLDAYEYVTEKFCRTYGSTLQVIDERNLARDQIAAMSETVQKTQEALDALAVVSQQQDQELIQFREQERQAKAAAEEERRQQLEIVEQLREMAPIAAVENAATQPTALTSDTPEVQTVVKTGQDLLALVEAMGNTSVPLELNPNQQGAVRVNQAVLEVSQEEQRSIDRIQSKLSGYYKKPPIALLAIFKKEAVQIQQFCESINKLLQEKVTRDDTDLKLVGETPLRALAILQTRLTQANEEIIEHHRRLEKQETTVDDLARIHEVCDAITSYKQEKQKIAQAFIPDILDIFSDKGRRSFPFILRELRGWMLFFDKLPEHYDATTGETFKNASGEIEIGTRTGTTPHHEVQHFREAITELHGTLEGFFRSLPVARA